MLKALFRKWTVGGHLLPNASVNTTVNAIARVRLLGKFDLSMGTRSVELSHSAQRVIAYLAFRGGRRDRLAVAATLWMDLPEERAAACLRTTLWRIRSVAPGLIHADGRFVSLHADTEIDFTRVAEIAHQLSHPSTTAASITDSINELTHELLPEWYDDWVIAERERFRQIRLHALEAHCRRLSARGEHAQAVDAGQIVVGAEPLRESGHCALIEAHLCEGNHSEALRQYERYRALLDAELGVSPSPRLRAIISDVAPRHHLVAI